MIQFEIGKTYSTRSVCDAECIYKYTVIARTKKRLTLKNEFGSIVVVRGIYISDDVECCKPDGTYSMCPVIRANKMYN